MKNLLFALLFFVPVLLSAQVNDDFDDGEITSNPTWTGNVSLFEILNPPTSGDGAINADAGNDNFVLRSLQQTGDAIITTQSNTAYGEWIFSLADGRNWSVSTTNDYKIILISDDNTVSNLTDGSHNFNGYFLQFDGGSEDQFILYKQTGTTSEIIIDTDYPATLDGSTPLGRTVKITRTITGEWSIFIDEGFDVTPTTQRGTSVIDNTHTTSNYFGIATNISTSTSDSRVLYFDNLTITPLPGNDTDSQVSAGSDSEPTFISSIENSADGVQVFDITLTDAGSGDGLATIIDNIQFTQGDANDITDWTDAIAGAKLFGDDLPAGLEGVISADNISFNGVNFISITENTSENYQLFIWLKTNVSNTNEGDNFEFKLDHLNITCDNTGSSFGSGSIESGDNNIAFNVEATQISLFYPTIVAQNVDFSLTAYATDINENIDTDITNSVTLSKNSGSGNLTSTSGLSQSLILGQKTWTDLQYDELGEFSISASSTGLTTATTATITSNEFVSFLNDDFEDGDIAGWDENNIGHWQASDTEPINGFFSLHHVFDADASSSDQISHQMNGLNINSDSTIWQFEVKYPRAPSATNCWNVFLMADNDNSQMFDGGLINGYVVGVNFNTSDDLLKLWEVSNGVATPIITTSYDWDEIEFDVQKSIVVSRSISGDWEIRIDENGDFDNLVSYGTGSDATHTDASYFGISYFYTSAADQTLWLDDIYVGPPIPDTENPFLTEFQVISPYKIQLNFNEDMDKTKVETTSNYTVDNTLGNPNSAVQDITNKRLVELTFASEFSEDIIYNMLIENVSDISENIIEDTVISFDWKNIDIESLRFISTTEIDVKFTKEVDSTTAVQTINYYVNNAIGEPISALLDENNHKIVHLTFANQFEYEAEYTLTVIEIDDIFGNDIGASTFDFIFYMVRRNDIIINELMVDINPAPIALPTNKYIEIYNTTDYEIDLTDWILKIGTNNDLVFPSMTIASCDYVIICSEEAETSFEIYGQVANILTESYLTSTTGKTIKLKNTKNEIVEQITYDPDNWYGDNDKDDGGWSMERIDPTNFCSQDYNWLATENYTGGTPGMLNSVFGSNPDNDAPFIEDFRLVASQDLIIDFSETVDTATANSILNYVLNDATIPTGALIDNEDNSIIHLHFFEHFLFCQNELLVKNISDYCGNAITDTNIIFNYSLIEPIDLEPKSSTQLKVYFSEPTSKITAENILNYTVNNGIGNPSVAFRDANDTSIVHLLFETEFTEDNENILTINGISDIYDNVMETEQIPFTYHIPNPFDVIINEIMVDVNPAPLGLPEVQYLELYNTSNFDIWLSDWVIIPENQDGRVFPTVKIPSNGFVLLCYYYNEDELTEFGTTVPILGSSDLTQSGKEIEIFDNRDNLIYHIRYSDNWYNNEDKDDGGWSLEKIDAFNFCESSFNWGASVDVSGGTPGRDNSIYQINPDLTKPELLNVTVKSSNHLIVQFSKNISIETALNVSNYSVSSIGNPQGVSLVDTSYSTVNLYFDNQFSDSEEYNLSLSNISDDCNNIINDTSTNFTYYLLHPEYIWVLNENQVQVKFSEEVELTTAQIKDNYTIDNQIGTPNYVVRETEDPSMIFLQFSTNFSDGVTYNINISDLQDINGNTMLDASLEFIYYTASVNDIVINEVLFNSVTGGADFVELYNRSIYPINLKNMVIAKRDVEGEISSPYKISDNNLIFEPSTYLVVTTDSANVQSIYNYGGTFVELNNMPAYPDDEGNVVIYDYRDSIIDEFSYNEDMHFSLISNQDGVSLERIDFNQPTQDSSNWHSAAEAVNFATPGLQNSQYQDISQILSVGEITLSPDVFSPDNDGYNDQLYINYALEQGGYFADVYIFDKNGRLIRTLTQNELLGTDGFWIWDGLNNAGVKSRIGVYAVVITLYDLSGNVQVFKKATVISAKY